MTTPNMSKTINDASTAELEAELKRRKRAVPSELDHIDWTPLVRLIKEDTALLATGKRGVKDFEHYVYEAALEAVYGNAYWSWRNAVGGE